MTTLRPESAVALTEHRRKAIRLAKEQEKIVTDKCIRSNQSPPGYIFDELIGKGSFGRVYKGRQRSSGKVVALKVLDVDEADFQAHGEMRDEQLRDFNKEIQILRRAQESGAENLNQMIEAFAVHSQLWLVCEYCPGGSVKTLMTATSGKLDEKYLIVVARELGKALAGLHSAGIMHRDVKAANVLIHENGGLQLCDFGIAAAVEGGREIDKRRTFVGTLHWMPPELWADKPEYNDEMDVWGYGCTLYECAVGMPPNSDVREPQQLRVRMRRLKQCIELPDKPGTTYSEQLKSLAKYSLDPNPGSRPTMKDILKHEYLSNTEERYPTSSLTELVQHYYGWLFGGGQRASLFMPGGAAAASEVVDGFDSTELEDWNFSMTQDFEKRVSTILDLPDLSYLNVYEEGQRTPRAPGSLRGLASPLEPMTATDKANFELRVQRGQDLSNLFDQSQPVYEYKTKRDFVPLREPQKRSSDLPFRAMTEDRPISTASVTIDLGDFNEDDFATVAPRAGDYSIQTTYADITPQKEEPAFILPDAATIRAKRADSKGPRDEDGTDSNVRRLSDDALKTPRPDLGAEITPRRETMKAAGDRSTMLWTFSDAMNNMSAVTMESIDTAPLANDDPPMTARAQETPEIHQKHATMDWSFANAMIQPSAESTDDEATELKTPNRHTRPRPLLRTMTAPTTNNEMHDIYDEFSRPSTAMSGAYSESSMSSTDVDPFALDRKSEQYEDGPSDEIEYDGFSPDDFYGSTTTTAVDIDPDGPGPDVGMTMMTITDGHTYTKGTSRYRTHLPVKSTDSFPSFTMTNDSSPGQSPSAGLGSPSIKNGSSPRALGHIRGNGSGASRGSRESNSSSGSTRMTNNLSTDASTSNGSGSSGTGLTGYTSASRSINMPYPSPPKREVMYGEASPTAVKVELERLLSDFQIALGCAAEVIGEGVRGRQRRRAGTGVGNNSEWEDETDGEIEHVM